MRAPDERVTFAANDELALHVPDPAAALAALRAAGCTLVPIGPHAPGEHYVRDPHGILFDVVERPANR